MNGLRRTRSHSKGNGCKLEAPENIGVVAVRDPGVERGWEAGSLYRSFQKHQQRRDSFAEVLRRHRFNAFGFLRRLSAIRIHFRVLPLQ